MGLWLSLLLRVLCVLRASALGVDLRFTIFASDRYVDTMFLA